MGDTAGLTMDGSPQTTIPLSPAPPDMSAAAGMGAQSLPASITDSGGGDIGSLMKQLNIMPNAPTAPQFTSAPGMKTPNLAAMTPTLQPMRPMSARPLSNQATSLKQARRQNRFTGITNAINAAANVIEEKKFNTLKTDISNVTRAQSNIVDAQRILNDKTITDPAVREAAQKSLSDNTKTRDDLLNDPKKQKEMAKAFDISFTDPSKNGTIYVKAGQAALTEADQQKKLGLDANNPNEKIVQDTLKQSVPGSPAPDAMHATPGVIGQMQNTPAPQFVAKQGPGASYGQQFADKTAMSGLQVNPQYEAQLAAATKQQELVLQHIVPRLLQNEMQLQQRKMMEDGAYARTQLQTSNAYNMAQQRFQTEKDIAKDRFHNELQKQGMADASRYRIAAMQVAATNGLMDNPDIKKMSPRDQNMILTKAKENTIKTFDEDINNSARQIDGYQAALSKMQADFVAPGVTGAMKDDINTRYNSILKAKAQEEFHQQQMRNARTDAIGQFFPSGETQQNVQGGQNAGTIPGFGSTGSTQTPNDDSAFDQLESIATGAYDKINSSIIAPFHLHEE